jgi:hypothetical protein
MKTKQVLIWLAAFAIVAVVVTTASMLRSKDPSDKAKEFYPDLTEEKIAKITFSGKDGTATVRRSGDGWVVESGGGAEQDMAAPAGLAAVSDTGAKDAPDAGTQSEAQAYPVDSGKIATALEKITSMKKDELVSTNPEKQSVFEVDSGSGTLVQAWDSKGDLVVSFRVGKTSASGYNSHYVRAKGADKVYSVRGSIKHAFYSKTERWRDKTVIEFPASAAKSIRLDKKGGTTIALEKSTDSTGMPTWKITAPEQHKAKTDKVDEIVNSMSKLTCAGWETDSELTDSAMGFTEPELIATVSLDGGAERTLIVGKKKESPENYWVRTPDKPGVTFRVSTYTIGKLDKNLQDLKAEQPTGGESASEEPADAAS